MHRFLSLKSLLFLATILGPGLSISFAQSGTIGSFEGKTNLDQPARKGSVVYDANLQQYTLSGSGDNMWFTHDQGYFVWKKMTGDFILQAQLAFIGKGVEAHRKTGWMIRNSLDSGSAQVSAVVHGNGLTSLQFRRAPGLNTEEIQMGMLHPSLVQLERKGGHFIMAVARDGDTLQRVRLDTMALDGPVYVGIFICSHNPAVTENAVFHNVRIIVPAPGNFVPYRDYIGSNMEIMNVNTGYRKIIYRYKGSFQAPNWSRDGKYLLFNQEGLLYKLYFSGGKPVQLFTGSATGNNNDHVISFDGKTIAISNQSAAAGHASLVYTLPITGGNPVLLTPQGPSYAHGWSPDGKWIVYTGQRKGEFDIYRMPATGGTETRLTDAKGLDDGSEYSPDGKYIYFNSERTGLMQIWRMRPDGSGQEQVTHDGLNDWFPHISPDGKWILFISFSTEVKSNDHPFYKQVYLRLMPVSGGEPRVIAYVYGGQGTMNTPNWAPDSRHIAFVSNSADIP
ncbi:MAG TPA: hypothetical protein VMV20_08265 [Chitinophagaceae bacterium]|nr:hypothetical protein [Chitinophagaceae bacterium]